MCLIDYLKIPKIAKNPSKILKSKNGYDIMLFYEKNKYYKLIVKPVARFTVSELSILIITAFSVFQGFVPVLKSFVGKIFRT